MTALQCNDDPAFQQAFWQFQRAAWALGSVVILAAAAGLTGSGGLFVRGSAEAGGAGLRYDHVARVESAMRLVFKTNGTPDVRISQDYLDRVRIVRIQPQPEAVSADDNGCARTSIDSSAAAKKRRRYG